MRKKRKKRKALLRRRRMRRPARLRAAGAWRSEHRGEDIVTSYASWFAVDPICAIIELRMLGVEVAVEHEQQIRLAIAARAAETARRRAETQLRRPIAPGKPRRRGKQRAANPPPPQIDWCDDWHEPWWGPISQDGFGATSAWIPTRDEYDELASLEPIEWPPTDEDYDDLASIEPLWPLTDEEQAALASLGPATWIPADEDYGELAALAPIEWPPIGDDYDYLASIEPRWEPSEDEELAWASLGAPAWLPGEEDHAEREPRGPLSTEQAEGDLDELPF
jgi:hypothetical protein